MEQSNISMTTRYAGSGGKLSSFFDRHFIVLTITAYLVMSAFKLGPILLEGRFWAEEYIMFNRIMGLPWHKATFFVFQNHLYVIPNLIVWSATLVDLRYAPLVTTYASYIVQSTVLCLLLSYRKNLKLAKAHVAFFAVISVGMVQSYECFANTTCLHFHCILIVSLIALIPVTNTGEKYIFRTALVLCGLTGIPANFLAPVFLLQGIVGKDRERLFQGAILCATALTQLLILYCSGFFDTFSDSSRNPFSSSPLLYLFVPAAQCFVTPVLGFLHPQKLYKLMFMGLFHYPRGMAVGFACVAPLLAFIGYLLWRGDRIQKMLALMAALLLVCCMATALHKPALISELKGVRYFFAPNMLLVLALLRCRGTLFACIVALTLFTSLQPRNITLMNRGDGGWKARVEEAVAAGASEVLLDKRRGWKVTISERARNNIQNEQSR